MAEFRLPAALPPIPGLLVLRLRFDERGVPGDNGGGVGADSDDGSSDPFRLSLLNSRRIFFFASGRGPLACTAPGVVTPPLSVRAGGAIMGEKDKADDVDADDEVDTKDDIRAAADDSSDPFRLSRLDFFFVSASRGPLACTAPGVVALPPLSVLVGGAIGADSDRPDDVDDMEDANDDDRVVEVDSVAWLC